MLCTKQEKLTEKAFMQSIVISVLGILLCMAMLCSVTWAWFSAGVPFPTSNIQSAYCDVSVSVTKDDATVDAVGGTYAFEKDQAYVIGIAPTGTSQTAYCILKINGTEYYTMQIPTSESIVFTLQFTADTTSVEILPRWGTSSQEQRRFADGAYYLNLVETLPSTNEP